MMTMLENSILYLKHSHRMIGLPLVVGGLILMLFGWRMWKVCVILAFGTIGAAICAQIAGSGDQQWLFALLGGSLLGLLSAWPVRYSVAVLGGLIGAGLVNYSLSRLHLTQTAIWSGAGFAMICCTAYAFINRRHVVIIVTAFMGAVLLIAGMTSWMMTIPRLYGTFSALVAGSSLILPFILMVPTVMSSFFQVAEVRRLHIDL
jgi:hypothetical protein